MHCGSRGLLDAADPEGRIVWEDGTLSDPVGRLLPSQREGVGYRGVQAGLSRFVNPRRAAEREAAGAPTPP